MLNVAQYQSWDELQALRELWNPLLFQSISDTVFLTWEWCAAWWKNYGAGRRLFVLAAWEGKEVVGIAPFYVDEVRFYGTSWKRLCLIGDGSNDSDYLDAFARCSRENEVISAFARFLELRHRCWDWLELNGTPQNSPCLAAIAKWAGERQWRFNTEVVPCTTLTLPNRWEDYLKALEPRFRTKVRASLTLIQKYLRSTPSECTSGEQIDDWLPLLFDLHTRRWGASSRPGVFRDPRKRAFYRDLSQAALEQGWLAFHQLNWGERPLALQYGLLYRNRFHLLQEAYDPEFATLRPGIALRAWLMRHWIEAGVKEYDFLAGVAPYKLDWGAQEKVTIRFLLAAKRASTIACLELPGAYARTKAKIRRVTPEVLLSSRRHFFSWRARRHWYSGNRDGLVERGAGVSRVARWLGSRVYSWTPLGSVGRSMATRYRWSGAAGRRSFPLRRRSQPVCQIFLYHRVNDDSDPFLSAVPVKTFRAQMQYLVRNFPLLTMDQVASGEFSNGYDYYAAVTFDDGYRDNFLGAFPILTSLGIPATIFLATGYIDSGELPWYDQVRLAFKLTKRSYFSMADLGGPKGSLDTLSDRLRSLEEALGWLRGMLQQVRPQAISELFCALGVPPDLSLPNQMLRWDDVRQMSKKNIAFGAHTISHPALSKIPGTEIQREVLGSKMAIENRLQLPVSHFAYPFGEPFDFNAQVKRLVEEAGFKSAVTTIWGLNKPTGDRFELRRFNPWEADPAMFKLKLDWYRFREPSSGRKVAGTG
jgi:CelD/BcsL family acetyltransferase involved in cellulose biosynthesis/peptidoglycan/xylan/chitin deacetylase (PgdA/CDA1 family)